MGSRAEVFDFKLLALDRESCMMVYDLYFLDDEVKLLISPLFYGVCTDDSSKLCTPLLQECNDLLLIDRFSS